MSNLIPDTIAHLDFEVEEEKPKLCAVHNPRPRPHKCLRPAIWMVSVAPPCGHEIPPTCVCDICWETSSDTWACFTCNQWYSMRQYMTSLSRIK